MKAKNIRYITTNAVHVNELTEELNIDGKIYVRDQCLINSHYFNEEKRHKNKNVQVAACQYPYMGSHYCLYIEK